MIVFKVSEGCFTKKVLEMFYLSLSVGTRKIGTASKD